MSLAFAVFSSVVCTSVALLTGCSSSQALPEVDRVEAIAEDAEQGFTLEGDEGNQQTPPPIVVPATDDNPADSNNGPEGDSSISLGTRQYPLSSALGDIWGVESNHFNVDFTLTDGKFTITPTIIEGATHNLLSPAKASGIFHAEMYSPGDAFSFETYSLVLPDANRDALAGVAFFDNAFVGVDSDNSGDVEEDEKLIVVGGTVAFIGAVPDIKLTFSVLLNDGQTAEGHYTGLFDFTER